MIDFLFALIVGLIVFFVITRLIMFALAFYTHKLDREMERDMRRFIAEQDKQRR